MMTRKAFFLGAVSPQDKKSESGGLMHDMARGIEESAVGVVFVTERCAFVESEV